MVRLTRLVVDCIRLVVLWTGLVRFYGSVNRFDLRVECNVHIRIGFHGRRTGRDRGHNVQSRKTSRTDTKETNPGDWQKEPMMKLPSMGKTENRTGESTSVEHPSRRSTIVRLPIRKTNLASWRAIPLEMFLLSAKPRFSW